MADFILGGSKITAVGDCSHKIKRHLLLGRKVMTNLDSILKSKDITLPTKVRLARSQHEVLHPWQRSWGRRLQHMQRWDRASGNPCSQASIPKTRVCLLYCFMLSPIPLTLRGWGALTPITSLREGVNLQLQVNKNSWVWQRCLRSNLSAGRLVCVTGLSILLPLRTWLFTTSQP